MRRTLVFLIGGLLVPAFQAQSHHSFVAGYNMEEIVTVTGIVTEVWYQNPHSRVYVEAQNNKGETVLWEMETFPRNILVRRGWRHDDLDEGDEVVVTGRQARDGGYRLQMLTITRPADGWVGVGFDPESVD